jgi:hypothetical protein
VGVSSIVVGMGDGRESRHSTSHEAGRRSKGEGDLLFPVRLSAFSVWKVINSSAKEEGRKLDDVSCWMVSVRRNLPIKKDSSTVFYASGFGSDSPFKLNSIYHGQSQVPLT